MACEYLVPDPVTLLDIGPIIQVSMSEPVCRVATSLTGAAAGSPGCRM
jgi:hypothetical protein